MFIGLLCCAPAPPLQVLVGESLLAAVVQADRPASIVLSERAAANSLQAQRRAQGPPSEAAIALCGQLVGEAVTGTGTRACGEGGDRGIIAMIIKAWPCGHHSRLSASASRVGVAALSWR